jgi:hypothetical protein
MNTKLNAAQLELMTKVRDRMYADYETDKYLERQYICHNIVQIEDGIDRFTDQTFSDLSGREGSLSKDLIEMIDAGIGKWVSFDLYLDEGLRIGLDWSKIVTSFAQLGRLAWLDRIVEIGEIK